MHLNQPEIRRQGEKEKRSQSKRCFEREKTLLPGFLPRANSLSLSLPFGAVLFLRGQEAAGISDLFFKPMFQKKGPAECLLLRLSKWEVHNAAVSKPLFSCLGEKGICQALEPDSLAV